MMRKYLILSTAVAFALSGIAFAQENSADLFADSGSDATQTQPAATDTAAESPDTGMPFKLSLSGSHEAGFHVPVMPTASNYDTEIKAPALHNDFGVEVQDRNVKLVSHWEFDLLQRQSDAENNDQRGTWNTLSRIRPLENYISWSPDSFKFAVGYQIYAWGVADKRNPTDNLNPRDYTTGINADKIPVLSADAIWYPSDSLAIEGVYIPFEQSDRWPADYKDAITGSSLSALGATDKAVSYGSLSYSSRSAIPGAKVSYRSKAADLSVSYVYDIDQYYTPDITTVFYPGTGYVVKSIELERKRIHRFGADAKTTLGKFGLWLEAAYSRTENAGSDDYSVRKSKLDYTAGLDTNFGPNDSYYVNFQLVGSWIPGYDSDYGSDYSYATGFNPTKLGDRAYMLEFYQRSTVNGLGFDNQGYLQGATMNLKFDLMNSLLTPQVTAAYMVPFNYDDSRTKRLGSLALNPELDIMPIDSFHIKLGADLFYAWIKEDGTVRLDDEHDMIGIYTPSNNVYIKVSYKWNYDLKK